MLVPFTVNNVSVRFGTSPDQDGIHKCYGRQYVRERRREARRRVTGSYVEEVLVKDWPWIILTSINVRMHQIMKSQKYNCYATSVWWILTRVVPERRSCRTGRESFCGLFSCHIKWRVNIMSLFYLVYQGKLDDDEQREVLVLFQPFLNAQQRYR